MQVIKQNRLLKLVTIAFLSAGILFFGCSNYIHYQEKQQPIIDLPKGTDAKIVFYRDDCTDCQEIFPSLYVKSLFDDDLIFVNLNQSKNRKYIKRYKLKEVPTIVNGRHSYSGKSKKNIDRILRK